MIVDIDNFRKKTKVLKLFSKEVLIEFIPADVEIGLSQKRVDIIGSFQDLPKLSKELYEFCRDSIIDIILANSDEIEKSDLIKLGLIEIVAILIEVYKYIDERAIILQQSVSGSSEKKTKKST